MQVDETALRGFAQGTTRRLELWRHFAVGVAPRTVAEIGVYRGDFAETLLDACESIETYYMIDPWRHLEDWNKPANKADDVFERFYEETLARTEAHGGKRKVLRGKTTEVIDQIPDGTLDFAYVDGDHTLRGVTIDLLKVFPKLRDGGWMGGDDFCRNIWQHKGSYEPTMVFPFAVHFAEAVGARLYALPHRQFALEKAPDRGFEFVDITGRYDDLGLRRQLRKHATERQEEAASEADGGSLADRVKRRLSR